MALLALPDTTHAQTLRAGDTFFGKIGVGLSDYTGDLPNRTVSHPLDFQEVIRGSGFPFMFNGELGYQFSPKWALAVGFQGGNYPIVGYAGGPSGISDSWRYTPQLLGRYTFGPPGEPISFYLDGGVNATFGGDDSPTSTGYGPTVGGGIDVPVGTSLSFYAESRFHFTLPDDAIDGSNASRIASGGPFDSVNQLLGFGVKVNLTTPVPPRVIALDGPTEVQTGTSVTYAATVNEGEASRPLSYQWQFGDGDTGSGLTASHTYDQPGTYTVTVTARNSAGEASRSLGVEARLPPRPARITSVNADPSPADGGEPVRFSSNVQGNSPISREWSFGDGSSATGPSPTHTYGEPGTYTARLQASNEAGEDSRTVTVRVRRVVPEICATVSELNSAFFERGSSALTDEARSRLRENAEVLSQCPNLQVRVEAVAAPGEQNPRLLSEERAGAVADFYEGTGVPDDRIETSGQGQVDGVTSKRGGARHHRRSDTVPLRGELIGDAEPSGLRDGSSDDRPRAGAQRTSSQVRRPSRETWGIVVASMSDREGAEAMVQRYKTRLEPETMAVSVVTADLAEGIRHRVVFGRFQSHGAAQQALREYEERLPPESWCLPLP